MQGRGKGSNTIPKIVLLSGQDGVFCTYLIMSWPPGGVRSPVETSAGFPKPLKKKENH